MILLFVSRQELSYVCALVVCKFVIYNERIKQKNIFRRIGVLYCKKSLITSYFAYLMGNAVIFFTK